MIKIDKLWDILEDRNVNTTKLRADGVVIGQSHTNLVKMLKGEMTCENLTLKTINSLCNYLDCQPGDILEFLPDENTDEVQHDIFQ